MTGIKILDQSIKYCNDVVDGKEITTDEVILQCKIFLDDYYKRQYDDDFEFYFDNHEVSKINNILKLFNYATGFNVGQSVYDGIADFQAFFITSIFGWRYKSDNKRFRYRDVVLFIPRKNAKTFVSAIIFLILMLTEQNYSEFYSICIDRDLAKEIRKAMKQLIESSPAINKHFFVSQSDIGKIECKLTKSFYFPRTAKADKNNSIRPSGVVADEVGAFTTVDNIQAMRTGQISVINPVMIKTTTAYAQSESIMIEELEYVKAVLQKTVKDERLFALVYYAHLEEAWEDIAVYRANPLRIEKNYEEIFANREKAKIKPKEQEEFLTKHLNIFLQSNELNKYLDINYWKKCRCSLSDFVQKIKGKNVVVSVDLSVTTDLTAVGIMFDDEDLIYCMSHGFLPRDSLPNRREKIDYVRYEKLGYCDIHDGMTVNYTKVEEYIRKIEETFECTIKCIVTDPMNAKEMMERLAEDYDVVMLKQTYTNLSPATKEFRKKVYDGKVRYVENELHDWNMQCASTSKGKADDEMLIKEDKNKQRIDMVVVNIFGYTEYVLPDNGYSAIDALDNVDWG